ncbi:MAG: hypothetical protein ACFFB8_05430 [Promethearchaeota archaeon]
MVERNQSFELRDKNFDDIQKIIENVLENNFSFSTSSKRLGSSLLRISYYDNNFEKEQQKDNRITILQESEKRVYIQIKGKLMDSQIGRLWNELGKNLNKSINKTKIVKNAPSKEEIIQEIKDLIEKEGYIIKKDDVQIFIENFIEEFKRLPKKEEFNSIVKGYIIMANEVKNLDTYNTNIINNEKNVELTEPYIEPDYADKSVEPYVNNVSLVNEGVGRKRCPNCGNDGLIHEMDDKSVILMDYPKIYAKKNCCAECGYEWRDH